jgi:hypothetical protein
MTEGDEAEFRARLRTYIARLSKKFRNSPYPIRGEIRISFSTNPKDGSPLTARDYEVLGVGELTRVFSGRLDSLDLILKGIDEISGLLPKGLSICLAGGDKGGPFKADFVISREGQVIHRPEERRSPPDPYHSNYADGRWASYFNRIT